jgi:tyrosyl-tRNA synthetase
LTDTVTLDEQLAYLTKGCVDVVRREDLRAKLEKAEKSGVPLTVKVGFDPTAPDLHLGHTVILRKMKHFQDLGHRVVFLIGDFTGLIGDPTGRSKTRPPLSRDEINANAETYKQQVFKLLDPVKTVVEFNSRWLDTFTSYDWVRLLARYNVAKMLERREFRQRYDAGQPIALHEFLYPMSQAYDSVALKVDVEMGGTDQLFNLNVGRDIMPAYDLAPQVVMTMPLLVGLDGVEKMSKSLGNYVGINEPAGVMFGKLMSVSDELMWTYYDLLTDLTPAQILALKAEVASGAIHPRRAKVDLAKRIVADFHSADAAAQAEADFDRVFVKKEAPDAVREVLVAAGAAPEADASSTVYAADTLNRILVKCGLAESGSEATRKIKQGGVKIDGAKVSDFGWKVPGPGTYLVQVGARQFVKLVLAG